MDDLNCMDLRRKIKCFRCVWRWETDGFAEHELRVSLSMAKEMYGFAKENQRFQVCLAPGDTRIR